MIETKYICDRCDHTQENGNQMWTVGFGCQSEHNSYSTKTITNLKLDKHVKLWCRKCCEVYGLLPHNETVIRQDIKKNVTLEDLIREIIKDELANYQPA